MTTDKNWKNRMVAQCAPSNVCNGMHMCPAGKFNSKEAKCQKCLVDSTEAMRQMDEAYKEE